MLQELIVVFVVSLLVLWLLLSVVFQFYPSFNPSWFSAIIQYDVFHFLPRWTFFAPNPGTSDYHLLYRDQQEDGSLSSWFEISMVEERKSFSFIWNPKKRSKKILLDVAMLLIEAQPGLKKSKTLMLSFPYLMLLNVVVHHSYKTHGTRRQFVLVEKIWGAEARVILISPFHPLQERTERIKSG
jgi:hypothetical protein